MGILHGPKKPNQNQLENTGSRRVQRKIRIFLEMWVICSRLRPTRNRLGARVPKMFVYIIYICVFWICFWYTYIFEFLVWISGYSFGFRVKIQILKIYFWVFRYNFGYFLVPQSDFKYNFRSFEYFLIFWVFV